jgi:GTP pyrophosphokinase
MKANVPANISTPWPDGTPENYDGFRAIVESRFSHDAVQAIMAAYELAKYGHRTQTRKDGGRYFDHPRSVAIIAIVELLVTDWRVVVDTLLHDIKEDAHLLQPWSIERLFGSEVANDLQLLTKEPKEGYLGRIKVFANERVLIAKLCDRTHNLREMGSCGAEHREKQLRETRADYLPLVPLLRSKLSLPDRWRADYLEREMNRALEHWS